MRNPIFRLLEEGALLSLTTCGFPVFNLKTDQRGHCQKPVFVGKNQETRSGAPGRHVPFEVGSVCLMFETVRLQSLGQGITKSGRFV